MNEQPKLFAINNKGEIDETCVRNLNDLSDGEKTLISLCFASLSGVNEEKKKLLLLDEIDAVLNPSLVEAFYIVLRKFFLEKNITVIMSTHSSATISLAPENATYYEIFKSKYVDNRILEVNRLDYTELKLANKLFYDRIENQSNRILELQTSINSQSNILIITEGKTDWKYFIKALEYFHSRSEFELIKPEYFYKFGSQSDVNSKLCGTEIVNELSESKLLNYLKSLSNSRLIDKSSVGQKRIGIFDSDTNGKLETSEELGVFSFKIQPDNISTEFLFSDEEIMTEIQGRRLYIGQEFDKRSKRKNNDSKINLGGDSQNLNKAGNRVIIDNDVYNLEMNNISISKDKFAELVYNGEIAISNLSWENFRHIFENIIKIIE